MANIWLGLLGVLVRSALLALGTSLEQHGAITQGQADQLFSTETQQQVVSFLIISAPILWGARNQILHLREKVAALHLSPGATLEDIKEKAADPSVKATDLARA